LVVNPPRGLHVYVVQLSARLRGPPLCHGVARLHPFPSCHFLPFHIFHSLFPSWFFCLVIGPLWSRIVAVLPLAPPLVFFSSCFFLRYSMRSFPPAVVFWSVDIFFWSEGVQLPLEGRVFVLTLPLRLVSFGVFPLSSFLFPPLPFPLPFFSSFLMRKLVPRRGFPFSELSSGFLFSLFLILLSVAPHVSANDFFLFCSGLFWSAGQALLFFFPP